MFQQLVVLLSTLAIPVTAICILDDWFLRPRRYARAGAAVPDSVVMKILYGILPILVIAGVVRLLTGERVDFSLVLVLITTVSGFVWLLDSLLFRRGRERLLAGGEGRPPVAYEPGTVDYARSFFPVAAALLVLRSFILEPYRIPSDSMMPTLVDGDFIVVNKYAYGLRWPVINTKFFEVGDPRRGDIVVFRFPEDPAINYIKRVVGLPGDTIEVRRDRLFVNGEAVPFRELGRYEDGCYAGMVRAEEILDGRRHEVLSCPSANSLAGPRLPGCDRRIEQSYVCQETPPSQGDLGDRILQVPEGQYLMIGDNRDNSYDGRYWGFVDESLLVGKATRIWFNWDLQRSGGPQWSRIGRSVE